MPMTIAFLPPRNSTRTFHTSFLNILVWEGFPECTFVRQMFGSGRVTDIWGRDLSMLGACQEEIDTYSMSNYKV